MVGVGGCLEAECLLIKYKALSLISCCKVRMYKFSLFVLCTYMYVLCALVCVFMLSCVLAHMCVSAHEGSKLMSGGLFGHSLFSEAGSLAESRVQSLKTWPRELVPEILCPSSVSRP